MVRSKVVLLALCLLLLTGCPGMQVKTDPYGTARMVVAGVQMAVPLAEGIFVQWALSQTDPAKVKAATAKFNHIKLLVIDGLRMALDGINIAEQAKKDPDLVKLMDQAELAWKDLRVFLTDLLGKPTPASLPAKGAKVEKTFDISSLPVTLLPKK